VSCDVDSGEGARIVAKKAAKKKAAKKKGK
jgi:hypothetical protein